MISCQKYSIIYADPPWWYSSRSDHRKTRFKGGAMSHYPVMRNSELKALSVGDLAADNCALFMWATMPNLPEQIEVLKSWGFRYVTVAFTWIKTNPSTQGRLWLTKKDLFFGVGYYTKSNAEICLLGIKGKMKPVSNSVSSAILSPRGRHSEKPAEIRDRIVALYGDVPRIELFARTQTAGWDCWGNEVDPLTQTVKFNKI